VLLVTVLIYLNCCHFVCLFVVCFQLAAQHKVKFFETSAWNNICIDESFSSLTESILHGVRHEHTHTHTPSHTPVNEQIQVLIMGGSMTHSKFHEF